MKNELKHVTFTGAVEAFKCSGDKDSLPLGNEQMLFIVFKSNVVKLVNITSHKTWLTYLLSAPIFLLRGYYVGAIDAREHALVIKILRLRLFIHLFTGVHQEGISTRSNRNPRRINARGVLLVEELTSVAHSCTQEECLRFWSVKSISSFAHGLLLQWITKFASTS